MKFVPGNPYLDADDTAREHAAHHQPDRTELKLDRDDAVRSWLERNSLLEEQRSEAA